MSARLWEEFVSGFREGWHLFWSPFTGLATAMAETRRCHSRSPSEREQHHGRA